MTQDRESDTKTAANAVGVHTSTRPVFSECDTSDGLSDSVLQRLWDAVLSPDRTLCQSVIPYAARRQISDADLADIYIPTIARHLGDMWCEDMLGFAQVTIGTARLQAMLRLLGPEWSADQTAQADGPLILLISPPNDQHTLGAILLAGQLRRRGYSVRLALHPTRDQLGALLRHLSFDAVFISASQSESLEKLRKLVDFLKTSEEVPLPIAVGGGILETKKDVAFLLGIEIATESIDEAIEKCGLTQRRTTGAIKAQEA